MSQQFIAEPSFWELFPQANLAVLILDNVNNQGESSARVQDLLAQANETAKKHLTADQLSQNPPLPCGAKRTKIQNQKRRTLQH